ncbi:MAG: M28 family metallopeptidase [Psychroflexus sp.]|nr:M28 family metallopeptidase [Psychroflexus sp.]
MRKIQIITIGLLFIPAVLTAQFKKAEKYANSITAEELKEMLFTFASDEFEGRNTGEKGQKKAAEYIADFYVENNIKSPIAKNDYFQEIPTSFYDDEYPPTENVLGFIPGKTDEIIVISAHYDHLGTKEGEVYNGADDDGSGSMAILEIAEAFKKAVDSGYQPKRGILFLHVTAEEKGLIGSDYYTKNPVFPLEQTISNLNIDMIGRVDKRHEDNPEYIYLIGSDRLSDDLHKISEKANNKTVKLALDYKYNKKTDPNRFYYRSDHYNFAKHDIPVIFYFNGTHQDYHQPTDTPDKINYDLLEKRTKLIFYTAWRLANKAQKPALNK